MIENVTYLEITNSGGIPTGEGVIVTGGIFEKKESSKTKTEIIAMETLIHSSLSKNKVVNFIKNDKLKIFNSINREEENVREDTPNRFAVYSDELGYGAIVSLEEINDEGVTITHF